MAKKFKYLFITLIFLLVGILYIYPDLRFIFELGRDFQGISFMGSGDETAYLSRIAGVIYRGDLRLANVGVYGHQNDPMLLPSFSEVTEGIVGKIFGLDTWQVDICATFLLPIVICFLIYLLAVNLSSSFACGVLSSLAVLLGYYWFTPNLKAIFTLDPDYFTLPLFFSRPISPQFNCIFLILSLYCIYKLDSTKRYYSVIFTGIITGLLFYTNLYIWSFVLSGLTILLIVNLCLNKIEGVKRYSSVFLISIVIGIPYGVTSWRLKNIPNFSEFLNRWGILYGHKPIIPAIEITAFIFLVIFYSISKDKKKQFLYMLSFVSGGLICLNQQVITGKTMQPSHWSFYTNKVFIIICFFVCFSYIFSKLRQNKYINRIYSPLRSGLFFYLSIFLFFLIGFLQQNMYYSARNVTFRKLQPYGHALNYIHKKLPPNAVILSDPFAFDEERFISIFTKNYPYISDSIFITSTVTIREIEERYFSALHFFGYSVSEAERLFRFMNGGLFRGMQVHPPYGGTPEKNNDYINSLIARYRESIKQDPLILLKKYKVDYVLLKEKDKNRILLNNRIVKILRLVYSDDTYLLYEIQG